MNDSPSPTSSPPTPPSSLPISFGPGNTRYSFSASSTPSPPFSPAPSSYTSVEHLPLLQHRPLTPDVPVPLVFSLDRQHPEELESKTTCLKDLLEWFIQRCCSCCNKLLENSLPDGTAQSFRAVDNIEFAPRNY